MTEDAVLEARSLTKRYRGVAALDRVNLRLERGEIYGFIGENGAGKTTLMRLIAGLSHPDEGELRLFGAAGESELRRQRGRIGCLIESPALYGNMTARQNLEMQRIQRRIGDRRCVDETLELVGLAGAGRKLVRHFSLGMRQRLGIALALVGNPEFLVLDEPVNGLDPAGVAEVRGLMHRVNRERGVTLFVSSHILPELYQVASRYILLHEGRVLEELSQAELDANCRRCIAIKADDPVAVVRVLDEGLGATDVQVEPDGTVLLYEQVERLKDVSRALSGAGVVVTGLAQRGESLEDYFLRRVGGE